MKSPVSRGLAIFGVMFVVSLIASFFVSSPPLPRYDISQPDRTETMVRRWVKKVLIEDLTLKSQDFDQKLQAAERFFTPDGYREFVFLLQQSRAIEYLREADVTFEISNDEIPPVIGRGTQDEAFVWLLEGDTDIKISFATNQITYPARLRYMITRSIDPNSFLGLKIRSITLQSTPSATN